MTSIDEQLAASEMTPTQADLEFPLPPSFDDVADERRHRKERLAAALRVFGRLGFAEGVAGHITARDPEHTDCFWVNPFGVSFNQMSVSDLILVDDQGQVIEGRRPVNAAAFAIHSQIHAARPDVIAAAHAHSVNGKAFSALGVDLKMLTQDHCMFYEDVALHTDSAGAIVLDTEAGKGIAASLGDRKAVVHQNHGLITVGESVDEAAWWFIALERACQVQLLAQAAGPVTEVDPASARLTYDQTGYSFAGWFQFQPFYADIVAAHPELLD